MGLGRALSAGVLATAGGLLLAVVPAAGSARTAGPGPYPALRWHRVAPTLAPQSLVILGDSVPAASGCGCPGFGPLLARDASLRSGYPSRLTNAAANGQTAQGLAEALRVPPVALRSALAGATAVTVTVGANDLDATRPGGACGGPQNLACFGADLAALHGALGLVLSRLTVLAPHAQVLLTGYWNVFLDGAVGAQQGPTYVRTSDALTRRVDADLMSLAQAASATYVDLYAALKGDGDRDDTALLAPDGDHPSQAGHRVIATSIERAAGWSS